MQHSNKLTSDFCHAPSPHHNVEARALVVKRNRLVDPTLHYQRCVGGEGGLLKLSFLPCGWHPVTNHEPRHHTAIYRNHSVSDPCCGEGVVAGLEVDLRLFATDG